jgi:hypothetical protein
MEAHDYPIAHFEGLSRLARALKVLSAQILEHNYDYESFGSWYIVVRHNGVVSRLVFDGRDNYLGLQKSASGKAPYQYGADLPVESGTGTDALDAATIVEICHAIAK